MSTPFQFGGPVSLPADPAVALGAVTKQYCDNKIPYSYMQSYSAPGGLPELIRLSSITQTVSWLMATSATANTVRTVTAAFPVGWDSAVPAKTVTGFQFWVAAAPSAATQSAAFAVYTGSALSTLSRVGSNGSFTAALATTGLTRIPFASTIPILGTSITYIAVQFSYSAPASGTGLTLAATPSSSSNLQGQGGKYGEWTTGVVTPASTLDASAAASSATQGQLVWVGLY